MRGEDERRLRSLRHSRQPDNLGRPRDRLGMRPRDSGRPLKPHKAKQEKQRAPMSACQKQQAPDAGKGSFILKHFQTQQNHSLSRNCPGSRAETQWGPDVPGCIIYTSQQREPLVPSQIEATDSKKSNVQKKKDLQQIKSTNALLSRSTTPEPALLGSRFRTDPQRIRTNFKPLGSQCCPG